MVVAVDMNLCYILQSIEYITYSYDFMLYITFGYMVYCVQYYMLYSVMLYVVLYIVQYYLLYNVMLYVILYVIQYYMIYYVFEKLPTAKKQQPKRTFLYTPTGYIVLAA